MKLKALMAASVTSLLFTTSAFAATLGIDGGEAFNLDSDFSLSAETGLSEGDEILTFDYENVAGNGLTLSGPAPVRITFLGKEAGATNLAFSGNNVGAANTGSDPGGSNVTELFNNQTSTVGDSIVVSMVPNNGFLDFLFETSGLNNAPNNETNGDGITSGSGFDGFAVIRNGTGADDKRIAFGVVQTGDRSAIVLFGDGRGDNDFDDMALRMEVVPLPAAGWMLLAGLGGMAALRRRQKS